MLERGPCNRLRCLAVHHGLGLGLSLMVLWHQFLRPELKRQPGQFAGKAEWHLIIHAHSVPFDRALLALPGGADHGPQSVEAEDIFRLLWSSRRLIQNF